MMANQSRSFNLIGEILFSQLRLLIPLPLLQELGIPGEQIVLLAGPLGTAVA